MNSKETFASIDGAKKNQKEALSPYKIGVLMFIQIFCSDTGSTNPVIEKRDFCISALKLIQSPDMGINGFFKVITSPNFKLSRLKMLVEDRMSLLVEDGVRKLLDLFDDLGGLMKPAVDNNPHIALLNKQSVLGLYVRRMIMLYEKLTFCKIVLLYEAFKLYFDEVEDEESMENINQNGTILYSNNGWGGRQAELLVAQQAQALLNDEHKALPPAELQTLVKDLLNSSPYYSEAHYLSYLNCLRVNEYCGALDSLYHCFDRLAPLEARPTADDKLRTFRYAALNLAALHAQFGYKELAQLALKEAIMLAQEAGDNVCLQLAHSWVYYLTSKNKKPLIERSIAKASGLNMTHTTSLALIASAHNSALEGKKPQQVFETLTKSDVLNNQHSMIDLISMIYAEKTALWAYYGKTEMSAVCAQLLLLFNSGEKKQLMFNGPSTCQAVVTVANILNEMGEYGLSTTVLAHAKERFPHQTGSRIWALSELLHEFGKLMRSEKWIAAEETALRMSSLDPVESKFRLAEVLLAKNNCPEALKLAHEIEEMEDITPQQQVRAKLQINQIECSSIYPVTPDSAVNSILLLNSALEIATSNHLSYYKALVNMHLANIQLLLGMPYQALNIIKEPIIQILAHGGLYDQGRAHTTYAKCLSANAESQTDASKKRGMIMEAIKHLNKAKRLFEKLEAHNMTKTTLFLLAGYYHEVDLQEDRNKCAFEYRQLSQEFPMKENQLFMF